MSEVLLRVQIATRQCDVSEEVLDRTHEQIGKLQKYDPRVGSAEVVFSEEKHSKKVEVILHIDGTAPIVANGSEPDFRSALDRTVDRVVRMLKKQRARHRDHQAPKLSEASVD